MSNRFNPRYIFTGTGHDYSCVALTGVRQDDFERILSFCEQSFGEAPSGSDWKRHRNEQAETIAVLRNGGYTVNAKGEITVVFEQYNPNLRSQPLSLQRVESVLTSAYLVWSRAIDPNHQMLSRLNLTKAPTRYAYLAEEKDMDLISVEDQRFYYLFTVLKERLDAPRMALYGKWKGPNKGWFARVVDMDAAERKERIAEAKDRADFHKRLEAMFAGMRAKKAEPVAA